MVDVATLAQYLHEHVPEIDGSIRVEPSSGGQSMFAAIVHGIAKRVLMGTSTAANAADVGRRAGAVAEIAWRKTDSIH